MTSISRNMFSAGPSRLAQHITRALYSSRRTLATEAGEVAAPTSAAAPSYAFSDQVSFPRSTISTAPSPLPRSLLNPKNGKSVVDHVNETLLVDYDPQQLRKTMFSRRHPDRVLPGSVVTVVSYTNATKAHTSFFSGVLLGIRRRGVDTSFVLRNVVNRTGVEMSFKIHSPLIKEIRVVKAADGQKGNLKNLGRARVNYLRDKPQAMSEIAAALKNQ